MGDGAAEGQRRGWGGEGYVFRKWIEFVTVVCEQVQGVLVSAGDVACYTDGYTCARMLPHTEGTYTHSLTHTYSY